MPAAIEKEPNVVKNAMKVLPCTSAVSIASCFEGSTSRPSGASTGSSVSHDLVGQRRAGLLVAAVGDQEWRRLVEPSEQGLRLGEREEERRAVRPGPS